MSKCTNIICDLCGKHIDYDDVLYNGKRVNVVKLKVKEFWHSFHESGWDKKTIHICPECQVKIKRFINFGGDNNAR